jgi:hypothetical protein
MSVLSVLTRCAVATLVCAWKMLFRTVLDSMLPASTVNTPAPPDTPMEKVPGCNHFLASSCAPHSESYRLRPAVLEPVGTTQPKVGALSPLPFTAVTA